MADNRMWLIHRPSKLGVMLGKRMAGEWYNAPDADTLNCFYSYIFSRYVGGDDFILAMENCEGSTCFNNWQYTGNKEGGFRLFEFVEVEDEKAE